MNRTLRTSRTLAALGAALALSTALAGCGSSAAADDDVKVTLILKDLVNPFFTALADGAKAQAK
jgi:fructose transport system substrate-binding protein